MKKISGIAIVGVFIMLSATLALAVTNMRTGELLETMDAGGYTYMLLDTDSGQIWVAGPETVVKVGETISVSRGMKMTDFASKTLARTFDEIYFVAKVLTPRDVPEAAAHTAVSGDKTAAVSVEGIARAEGGKTVAELLAQGKSLVGEKVKVRGRVVKFTPEVMNTNWIHLQDGSGGDLTVTSGFRVSVGDLILVTGTLAADKDFGAGYKYDVIVEKATVVVE